MLIGIVGLGHVGSAMHVLFPDAVIYDPPKGIGNIEEINRCDITFVCVPTPQRENGSCNTDIVDDVLSILNNKVIVLRSTVPVGYTEDRANKLGKRIVFQPEYYGETTAHPFADLQSRKWITLGGNLEECSLVANAYRSVYTSELHVHIVDAKTAELAKYMENSFLAAKVTFCNEFYDLAEAFGVNYDLLRETWLLDPRIGRSHTFVYDDNRGYGGSCLPKDIAAIVFQGEEIGADVSMLKGIIKKNKTLRQETK